MGNDLKISPLKSLWDAALRLASEEDRKSGKPDLQIAVELLLALKLRDDLTRELGAAEGDHESPFRNFQASVTGYSIWQIVSLELIGWSLQNLLDLDGVLSDSKGYSLRDTLRAFLKIQLAMQHPGEGAAIDPVPVLVPRHLLLELVDGLSALDRGEVTPLLMPRTTGRHGDTWTWDRMRTRALQYVDFLRGQGHTYRAARQRVALAIDVSPDTLRAWASELTPTEPIEPAFKAGQLKAALDDNPNYGRSDGQLIDASALFYLNDRLSEPLSEFGLAYQKAFGARSNQ